MGTQIVLSANMPARVLSAIARTTFPTKSETAQHYPVYFRYNSDRTGTVWRVFRPDVPANVQRAILSALGG